MAVRYVTSGTGTSSGNALTIATAWPLTYAFNPGAGGNALVPGDEVRILNDGVYTLNAANRGWTMASGTSGSPITVRGAQANGDPYYGRGRVRLKANASDDWDVANATVGLRKSMISLDREFAVSANPIQYISWKDLWFDGNSASYNCFQNGGPSNDRFDNNYHTFDNCVFSNSYHNALSMFGGNSAGTATVQDAHTVNDCQFFDVGQSSATNVGIGIVARPHPTASCGSKTSFVVTRCLFVRCSSYGIAVAGAAVRGSTITNCVFLNGLHSPPSGSPQIGAAGLNLASNASPTTEHSVSGCLFANMWAAGLVLGAYSVGLRIKNCGFFNNGLADNQTTANDTHWFFSTWDSEVAPAEASSMFQNCCFGGPTGGPAKIFCAGGSGDTFTTAPGTGHTYGVDPQIISPTTPLSLQDGTGLSSTLRNAGVGGVQVGPPTTNVPHRKPYYYYGR